MKAAKMHKLVCVFVVHMERNNHSVFFFFSQRSYISKCMKNGILAFAPNVDYTQHGHLPIRTRVFNLYLISS